MPELVQHAPDVAGKQLLDARQFPSAAFGQPHRKRVVVKRDDGFDAALAQGF